MVRCGGVHTGWVIMYVTLLSCAMDLWDTDLDGESLLDHVCNLRAALPYPDPGAGACSAAALATEIAYDRAIVCLAAQHGIEATPQNFVHPRIERDRLELELVGRGVDLDVALASRTAWGRLATPDS